MGFLAPAFLLGFLAIALPLWLHRLQAQSSVRQTFSSAMLLEASEEQVHVQRKLKYFVLLALRIALLVVLAVAFAKPFLARAPQVSAVAAAGSSLIVVDTSVSMQREGVFSQALNEARRAIDEADTDTLLQVMTADATMALTTSPSTDKRALRTAVAGLSAGALRLDYGELMAAVERHAATLPAPVRLHLVSDFQASAMPVRFAELVSSSVAEFFPHVVGTGSPVNWSIDYLRGTVDELEVSVSGYGDRETIADIELSLNGVVVESRGLAADGQQTIRFTVPQLEQGDNRITAHINSADDLQADNQWFHVLQNQPPLAVPLITSNPAGLPVTYLSAALSSAAGTPYLVQPMMVGQFDTRVLARYRWLVIDEIGALDNDLAAAVVTFLQEGGNVLAFAGDRAAALANIPVSGHRHVSGNVAITSDRFVSVGQVDTTHQALVRGDGWRNVKVSRSMPVTVMDDDQVLVRLQNGDPFLLEKRFGSGRLLLLLGGLDNRWSDLPVRPAFVSFISDAARYLSGVNEIPRIYTSGASLPLLLAGNLSGQVVDPDGVNVLSLVDTTREQQIKLNKPGFYEVYTPQGETLIAANIDPLESDLRTISQDVLERWREAMDGQAVAGDAPLIRNFKDAMRAGDDAASRLEFWHWLLLFAVLVLIAESFLGNTYLATRRVESG
jgi:hypothetical protein